ncbi:MAG: HAD family hydrolase [Athalassotoga sp.]
MIKFVGIDLDGTLLDSDKKISEENLKALEKLEKSGIHVTIFTGRSFVASEEYFGAISSDIPGVFQNGAFISTIKTHRTIKKVTLSYACASKIVYFAKKYDLFSVLFTHFTETPDMVYEEEIPSPSSYKSYFERNAYRMIKVPNIFACIGEEIGEVAVVGNFNKIKTIEKEMDCSEFTMVLSTLFPDNEGFVEFFGPGCGKEKALDFLLKKFGMSREESAFIGDNYNDLEALKIVGHPIVMGNNYTPVELINVAKYITSSNDEDGVAKAIKEYILSI